MNTLELYQEAVPFSNKRLNRPVSTDGSFNNPVIVPFAFDFTANINSLECIIYLRNRSQEFRYENVVISLMSEDLSIKNENSDISHAQIENIGNVSTFKLNGYDVPAGYSTEQVGEGFQILSSSEDQNGYFNYYKPVVSDETLSVKFSYGYEELTVVDWEYKNPVLIIPYLGTSNMPDTSYHPIRMRIIWATRSQFLTTRNYFLDVSYQNQIALG